MRGRFTAPRKTVATDGTVEDGHSAIDMSMLTGESVPVEVGPGSDIAGATVNAGGRLIVRATKVDSDTALAHDRPPCDRRTDRQGAGTAARRPDIRRVVPVAFTTAISTLAFWLGTGQSATFAFTSAVAC